MIPEIPSTLLAAAWSNAHSKAISSDDIIADGFDPRLLGLFQGTPMPEDGALAPSVTNILLFKRNLERFAEDEEHLAEEVRITVLHETAHYFGLDEDDLAAIGLD